MKTCVRPVERIRNDLYFVFCICSELARIRGVKVLRAGRHTPLDRQVGEELLDLGAAHVARMPLLVEEDEAGDPLDITRLGGAGVVADAQDLANLVEQAGRLGQWQFAQVEVQHFAVEEGEGVAAGGDGPEWVFFGLGEGLQELADLGQAHLARMALAVEE